MTSDFELKGSCTSSCSQVTSGVCSSTFLAGVIKGDGIKAAYCNDKWLVITATGEINTESSESDPQFSANLNDVPYPPAADLSGTTYRTGDSSIDFTRTQELFFPLSVTDLSTSAGSNNIGVYDVTTGTGAYSYLIDSDDSSTVYGLPSDDGIGMAVNGQPILYVLFFPAPSKSRHCLPLLISVRTLALRNQ